MVSLAGAGELRSPPATPSWARSLPHMSLVGPAKGREISSRMEETNQRVGGVVLNVVDWMMGTAAVIVAGDVNWHAGGADACRAMGTLSLGLGPMFNGKHLANGSPPERESALVIGVGGAWERAGDHAEEW